MGFGGALGSFGGSIASGEKGEKLGLVQARETTEVLAKSMSLVAGKSQTGLLAGAGLEGPPKIGSARG